MRLVKNAQAADIFTIGRLCNIEQKNQQNRHTNTGPSVINGDLGLYPGTSITGFPPGVVNGVIHQTDGVAMGAQADALTAYNVLAGLSPDQNLTGMDLGGLTLLPGTYKFNSSALLTGMLTLNFQGLNNRVFSANLRDLG